MAEAATEPPPTFKTSGPSGEEETLASPEESFENAAPVPIERAVRRVPDDDDASAGASPRLDAALAELPETNKRMIDELFRGRFIAVRRIRPERMH